MTQLIIGFGNKARQGKDVAIQAVIDYYAGLRAIKESDYLSSADVPNVMRIGFADPLYRVCREEYGMKEKDARLLQKVGDGRREEFGHDYWLKQAAETIRDFEGIVMFGDMRYTNEADWIKSMDGYTVQITRRNTDGTQFITTDRDPRFVSEVQLDSYVYDFKLINSYGHQALLAEQAITLVEYLRELHTNWARQWV